MSRHAYAPQIDARPRRLSPERERAIELEVLRKEVEEWQAKKAKATSEGHIRIIESTIDSIQLRIKALEGAQT